LDPRNLWPQHEWNAEKKDDEFVMYKTVCAGEIRISDAQRAMATD
jgi:hypothetical protein